MRQVPQMAIARGQDGVALLEALIAILIFSFGVLGIVGLQAAMVTGTTDAKYRAEASFIAQQRVGQMWADSANAVAYLEDSTDVSDRLPGGMRSVVQPVTGQFEVRVGWTAPGETPPAAVQAPCQMLVAHCFMMTASVVGGT